MRTYKDAKAMARALRESLAADSHTITHSEALELVAVQFECKDWNTLAARIDADKAAAPGGIRFDQPVPILRILSVEKALEFYVGFLGFMQDWEHRFDDNAPLYTQVSRGGLRLHLTEHYGDALPGAAVYLGMIGIAEFHKELSEKQYRYARPGLENTPWGTRGFVLTDPFGNRLSFNEPT